MVGIYCRESDIDPEIHINLSAFGSVGNQFHSENSVLPDFSIPRVPTVSLPFLEKGLRAVYNRPLLSQNVNLLRPPPRGCYYC